MTAKAVELECNSSATDSQTYTTGSLSPAAGSWIYACVVTEATGTAAQDLTGITGTLGTGLTWAKVSIAGTPADTAFSASSAKRLLVYRAFCASGSGTLTFTIGASVANVGCEWSVWAVTGLSSSAPEIKVTAPADSGSASTSLTLSVSVSDPHNPVLVFMAHNNNEVTNTNWTADPSVNGQVVIGAGTSHGAPAMALRGMYRHDGFNATGPQMSNTSARWAGIAIELGPDPAFITVVKIAAGTQNTPTTANGTGSVSLHKNKLIVVAELNGLLFSVGAPSSITWGGAGGLTFVQAVDQVFDFTSTEIGFWRAMRTSTDPGTGVITINFSGGAPSSLDWIIFEIGNVDTSGTNGSGAIVQAHSASSTVASTPTSPSMGAFASSHNGTIGVIGVGQTSTVAPGSGFVEVGEQSDTGPDTLEVESSDANQTTVTGTVSGGSPNYISAVLGVEIKCSGSTQVLTATTTEAPTTTDVATRTGAFLRTTTEAPTTSDAATELTAAQRSTTEAPHTSDTATRTGAFARTATEAPTTADVATRTTAAHRTATEAPTTSDAATRALTASRTATEAPSTTDVATDVKAAIRSATEAPSTADVATRTTAAHRTATEAPTTADTAADTKGLLRSASETPSTTDAATRTTAANRTATEAPATVDAATRTGTFSRTTTEAPTTSDAATATKTKVGNATEAPTTSDVATRTGAFNRATVETPSTTDVNDWTAILARTTSEHPTTSDGTPTATVNLSRTAFELPTTADTIVRALIAHRTVTEHPSTVDTATRVLFALRQITGAITPTGTIARRVLLRLDGGISPAGAITKRAMIDLAGALDPHGSAAHLIEDFLSGAIDPHGLNRDLAKIRLDGSIDPAGVAATTFIPGGGGVLYQLDLAGSITPEGDITTDYIPGNIVYVISSGLMATWPEIQAQAAPRRVARGWEMGALGRIRPTGQISLRLIPGRAAVQPTKPLTERLTGLTEQPTERLIEPYTERLIYVAPEPPVNAVTARRRILGRITPTGSISVLVIRGDPNRQNWEFLLADLLAS